MLAATSRSYGHCDTRLSRTLSGSSIKLSEAFEWPSAVAERCLVDAHAL